MARVGVACVAFAALLAVSPVPAACAGEKVFPATDITIQHAVSAWCADAKAAEVAYGEIDGWDTSGVKVMKELFKDKGAFNVDINSWTTSAVVDMGGMFYGARQFNQNINAWQIGSVTSTGRMFYSATEFNQPLNSWQTGWAEDFATMFSGAGKFNQPLNSWQTGAVNTTRACSVAPSTKTSTRGR